MCQLDTATVPVLTSLGSVLEQVAAPTVPAKACSRCGATKPASDFNINKTTSSGLTSHCKVHPLPFDFSLSPFGDVPFSSRQCQLLAQSASQFVNF